MKRVSYYRDSLFIGLLGTMFFVPSVFAQGGTNDIGSPFAPIVAGSLTIERLLQLIRNILSPDPEQGFLRRGSKALRYYTTLGGTGLGLALAFSSNLRLLATTGITLFDPTVDAVLTGIVIGMGTELVHEVIGVAVEGKNVLRATAVAKEEEAVG
ncbi:MAG TPA: hypothetical protein VGJ22_12240 [Anaerolineales bacterium]|jgi:hypothetical protein